MSVRAISQAKKEPMNSAMACLVIASVKVLVIAFTIPGVVKAFTQPFSPQTMGSPGRAICMSAASSWIPASLRRGLTLVAATA